MRKSRKEVTETLVAQYPADPYYMGRYAFTHGVEHAANPFPWSRGGSQAELDRAAAWSLGWYDEAGHDISED